MLFFCLFYLFCFLKKPFFISLLRNRLGKRMNVIQSPSQQEWVGILAWLAIHGSCQHVFPVKFSFCFQGAGDPNVSLLSLTPRFGCTWSLGKHQTLKHRPQRAVKAQENCRIGLLCNLHSLVSGEKSADGKLPFHIPVETHRHRSPYKYVILETLTLEGPEPRSLSLGP